MPPPYENESEDTLTTLPEDEDQTHALHLKDAMTRQEMSPASPPRQPLKIKVPDGPAQSRPPTAAVFLIYFDPKAG